MGYGYYVLPDGREAGYNVEAKCDVEGCFNDIDRGLSYLCGELPDGHRDPDEPGCGKYFCGTHEFDHDCPNPEVQVHACDDPFCCYPNDDWSSEDEEVSDPTISVSGPKMLTREQKAIEA